MVKGTIDTNKVPSGGNYINEPGMYKVRIEEVDDSKFHEYESVKVLFKCIDDSKFNECFISQYLTLNEENWKTRFTVEMMKAIGVIPKDQEAIDFNTALWLGGECIVKLECNETANKKYWNITAYYSLEDNAGSHVTAPVKKAAPDDDIPF